MKTFSMPLGKEFPHGRWKCATSPANLVAVFVGGFDSAEVFHFCFGFRGATILLSARCFLYIFFKQVLFGSSSVEQGGLWHRAHPTHLHTPAKGGSEAHGHVTPKCAGKGLLCQKAHDLKDPRSCLPCWALTSVAAFLAATARDLHFFDEHSNSGRARAPQPSLPQML